MEIQITKATVAGDWFHFAGTCGKTSAEISIRGSHAEVWVCCQNAAHKVWRGMGKRFETVAQSLAAYKSPAMQSLIRAAADEREKMLNISVATAHQ